MQPITTEIALCEANIRYKESLWKPPESGGQVAFSHARRDADSPAVARALNGMMIWLFSWLLLAALASPIYRNTWCPSYGGAGSYVLQRQHVCEMIFLIDYCDPKTVQWLIVLSLQFVSYDCQQLVDVPSPTCVNLAEDHSYAREYY